MEMKELGVGVRRFRYTINGGMSGERSWKPGNYCEEVRGIIKDIDIVYSPRGQYSITTFYVNGEKYEILGENGLHIGLHFEEGSEVILHVDRNNAVAIEVIRDEKVVFKTILVHGRESDGSIHYRFTKYSDK
ncbi:MAG: hypothetical protein GF365_01050 [Candidatus Buchananbacteria bacterium]|nr:hypothetical protein [Candidatus Buchananbacteria bacterium]